MAASACSISIALTPTPRTSTREGGPSVASGAGRTAVLGERTEEGTVGGCHAGLDPLVGAPQSLLQRDLRFPSQHLTQTGVVAVPPPNPLRRGEVMPLAD